MMKTPDSSIMLMSNWEEKIEKICETTIKEDVRCLAGVPSWFLTVIHKILEKQEKATCMKCGLTWSCLFMVGLVLFLTGNNTNVFCLILR